MKSNRRVFRCAGLVALAAWFGCSHDDTQSPRPTSVSSEGSARLVPASGALFRLGSPDAQASSEELPGWTRFAHGYWLDTSEVTQAEYQVLMGRNPSPSASKSPAKPVVNVSWFDAVLFCNARSKRDHFDTVYDYASVSLDSSGSAWNLPGLTSHLERNGWRLPSEAEWECAARGGSTTAYPWGGLSDSSKALDHAWFQRNAGAFLHEVARLKPNSWGFHDMAGNAMEWVQDWKGSFPDDTVTDFVGPDAPPDVPEAPLKGGAYNYGLEHLRPSSRTATYAAYRSAKAEYVGFRCARGAFTPTYNNASGQSVQAPPVSIPRTDVAGILGAQSARLVFLNRTNSKGILSWIDYGEANPVVRSLPDVDPVFHPVISPDGQWVAWCTIMEGGTGTSRIKARRLARNDSTVLDLGPGAIPRWWVDGRDTFLVRSTSAMDNTASGWGSGQTLAQRWSNGIPTGATQTWTKAGSYHDGRSGQFLYTGYRRLKQFNVASSTGRTLFTYPQNGKSPGDTSQVCNASAAPDGSGRVMFLDFGYSGTSSILGRPYGIHEVAFLADSLGNIQRTFPVASGKSQWDHLEWSNHPQWVVGVASEQSNNKEIDLLDLSTGNTTALAQGSDLWMPQIWVGAPVQDITAGEADPDSAVRYHEPVATSEMGYFGDKLLRFWIQKDSAEVVLVGSSHFFLMLPSLFPNHKAVSLDIPASTDSDWDLIIRRIVVPNASKTKIVALTWMPGWLFPDGPWPGARWEGFIAPTTGIHYDESHGYWKDGFPKGFTDLVWKQLAQRQVSLDPPYVEILGDGWKGTAPDTYPSPQQDTTTASFRSGTKRIKDLAELLASKGIHLLLVNCPQSPYFKNTKYAGRYGPTWELHNAMIEDLRKMESNNAWFHFYDAHQGGNHDYSEADAANQDHLNSRGSMKLAGRMDSVMSYILAR